MTTTTWPQDPSWTNGRRLTLFNQSYLSFKKSRIVGAFKLSRALSLVAFLYPVHVEWCAHLSALSAGRCLLGVPGRRPFWFSSRSVQKACPISVVSVADAWQWLCYGRACPTIDPAGGSNGMTVAATHVVPSPLSKSREPQTFEWKKRGAAAGVKLTRFISPSSFKGQLANQGR